MTDWQARYAHVYAGLDPAARDRVVESIQSGYLEGYEPTEADVRRMVRLELGEITAAEAIAEAVALVRARRRAREAQQASDSER
jgi:Antitoxin VbhA